MQSYYNSELFTNTHYTHDIQLYAKSPEEIISVFDDELSYNRLELHESKINITTSDSNSISFIEISSKLIEVLCF